MNKDEALKLALKALETPRPFDDYPPLWRAYKKTINEAITAIKEALAQPESVGKFAKFTDNIWREVTDGSAGVPLYITPPQRKPLTDEEIAEVAERMEATDAASSFWREFARAIEAAYVIKE